MKTVFFLIGMLWASAIVAGDTLMIRTSQGEFGKALEKAYIAPFAEKYGVDYQVLNRGSGLATIRAEHESDTGSTDLTTTYENSVMAGCDQGLFEPVGDEFDKSRFIDEAVMECGVGLVTYQTAIATQAGSEIETVEDFFNPDIPGNRGMIRRAEHTLELALIGDGVEPSQVSEVLSSPGGVERAFDTIERIKDKIDWYGSGSQATQMLIDEQVVAAVGYDGRWMKAQDRGYDIEILRDGFVTGISMLAITSYSDNKELANKFLHYATRADVNDRALKYAPYGPAVTDHGGNFSDRYLFHSRYEDSRVIPDVNFWYEHSEPINNRFAHWIAK